MPKAVPRRVLTGQQTTKNSPRLPVNLNSASPLLSPSIVVAESGSPKPMPIHADRKKDKEGIASSFSKTKTTTAPSNPTRSLLIISISSQDLKSATEESLRPVHPSSSSSPTSTATTFLMTIQSFSSTDSPSTTPTKHPTHFSGDMTAGSTDVMEFLIPLSSVSPAPRKSNVSRLMPPFGASILSLTNSKSTPTVAPTNGVSTTDPTDLSS